MKLKSSLDTHDEDYEIKDLITYRPPGIRRWIINYRTFSYLTLSANYLPNIWIPDEGPSLAITLSSNDAEHRALIMEYSEAGISITRTFRCRRRDIDYRTFVVAEDEAPIIDRGSFIIFQVSSIQVGTRCSSQSDPSSIKSHNPASSPKDCFIAPLCVFIRFSTFSIGIPHSLSTLFQKISEFLHVHRRIDEEHWSFSFLAFLLSTVLNLWKR